MGEKNVDDKEFKIIALRFVINYAVRFFSAALLVYTCWIPFQNITGWFSYHVILCTFGYIPLMAEAIMMFMGDDIWSKHLSRKGKYVVHGILITVGTVFATAGNILVFLYIEPGYHLYTAHGITGLVSMILLIIAIILGLAVNYPKQADKILALRSVTYKLLHNISGLLGYGIGIVSLGFGYFTRWFSFYNGEESRWAALVITILISIWSITGALVSLYNQFKSVVKGYKTSKKSSPIPLSSSEIIEDARL